MTNHKHYLIKLDSHVHFYQRWKLSLEQFLTTTHNNLTQHSENTASHPLLPAICLLDTEKDADFGWQKLNNLETGKWQKENIKHEPHSFWFRNKEKTLLIVTGTQINTAEGLEVLMIGNKGEARHGMPIKTVLKQQDENLLSIIPWAAGKWLSKRGELLDQLLTDITAQQFVLGDNAGRPRLWKHIRQLEYAKAHNIPVLCGSDPLPLHQHYLKSGTYGNLIETNLDLEKPWTSIIQAIHKQARPKEFGQLSSLSSFVINQLKLRL